MKSKKEQVIEERINTLVNGIFIGIGVIFGFIIGEIMGWNFLPLIVMIMLGRILYDSIKLKDAIRDGIK